MMVGKAMEYGLAQHRLWLDLFCTYEPDGDDLTKLWGAILRENLRCALGKLGGVDDHQSGKRSLEIRRAEAWIGSKDFYTVCDMAGFDADAVNQWYQQELNQPDPGAALTIRREAAA